MQENPFRPAFGVSPPEIIGRDRQITGFLESLDRGIGHPHRSTILIGARGMGKTVVLFALPFMRDYLLRHGNREIRPAG